MPGMNLSYKTDSPRFFFALEAYSVTLYCKHKISLQLLKGGGGERDTM
jgi:hypothetical protein